jgi:ElaA protein
VSSRVEWQWSRFDALSAADVYAALVLRQRVFVVEQRCLYLDADGRDPQAFHLFGWTARESDRMLAAYARVFPPGAKRAHEVSIGRVVTDPSCRGSGIGRTLMTEALREAELAWPGIPVHLDAQLHLERFYHTLGFARASEIFDDDGIPHVSMVRPPAA